jgi:SAM-dependent methyltransferase
MSQADGSRRPPAAALANAAARGETGPTVPLSTDAETSHAMAAGMVLPPGCEPYLALQRTSYQHPMNRPFRRLGLGALYDRLLLATVEGRRRASLARLYHDDLQREYVQMAPFLPPTVGQVLDVGCGLGGIDLFLHRHYRQGLNLVLLDREGRSGSFYGFRAQAAFYNSLDLTRALLCANGVRNDHVSTFEVDRDGFPDQHAYDLVVSLLSWGFHYPVETYLERVLSSLSAGGVLIIDVRKGTDGERRLETAFGAPTRVIADADKHRRLAFTRAPLPG